MADFYLKNLVPFLARSIKDIGTMDRDGYCGLGDGANKTFQTPSHPVKIGSLTAYVNGVAKTVSSYDYVYGLFTLVDAPASGARVTARYVYYSYPDGLLQDYIADGVIRMEMIYYQGYVVKRDLANDDAYLEAEPNQRVQMAFVLQATIHIVEAGLAQDNLIVTREWKDEDVGESYTKSALLARAFLDRLYSERATIIANLKSRSSSYGRRLESDFNTDESRYRYLDGIANGAIVY